MSSEKDVREMMLFDYLEGSLSEREVAALEAELLIDPDLKDELNEWQNSYINAEIFDTSKLETQIIDATSSGYNILSYLNLLLVVGFMFLSGHKIQNGLKAEATKPFYASINTLEAKNTSYRNMTNCNIIPSVNPKHMVDTNLQFPQEVTKNQILAIESMVYRPLEGVTIVSVGIGSLKTRYKPKSQKKKMTRKQVRKQEREIARIKRKAVEKRQAYEFMKGNTPYVVPLDLNNF